MFLGISFRIAFLTGIASYLLVLASGRFFSHMHAELGSIPIYIVSLYLIIQFMAISTLALVLNLNETFRTYLGNLISVFTGFLMTVVFTTMFDSFDKIIKGSIAIGGICIALMIFDNLPSIKEDFFEPTKKKWVIVDRLAHVVSIVLVVFTNGGIFYLYEKYGLPLLASFYSG